MNAQIKYDLQEKLNYHFNRFKKIRLNGSDMSVLPRRSEIPQIKRICYDKTQDTFLLTFIHSDPLTKYGHGNIYFMEEAGGQVCGIIISNARKTRVPMLHRELSEDVTSERERLKKRCQGEEAKLIADVEDRKFSFFSDLISSLPKMPHESFCENGDECECQDIKLPGQLN